MPRAKKAPAWATMPYRIAYDELAKQARAIRCDVNRHRQNVAHFTAQAEDESFGRRRFKHLANHNRWLAEVLEEAAQRIERRMVRLANGTARNRKRGDA